MCIHISIKTEVKIHTVVHRIHLEMVLVHRFDLVYRFVFHSHICVVLWLVYIEIWWCYDGDRGKGRGQVVVTRWGYRGSKSILNQGLNRFKIYWLSKL